MHSFVRVKPFQNKNFIQFLLRGTSEWTPMRFREPDAASVGVRGSTPLISIVLFVEMMDFVEARSGPDSGQIAQAGNYSPANACDRFTIPSHSYQFISCFFVNKLFDNNKSLSIIESSSDLIFFEHFNL